MMKKRSGTGREKKGKRLFLYDRFDSMMDKGRGRRETGEGGKTEDRNAK